MEFVHIILFSIRPILLIILLCPRWTYAQELPLVLDKQGTFEILSRTDYTMPDFGFAKAEMTANLQRIKELVNVIRKNPVLTEMKGFDGRARIYTISMKDEHSYGVPSRISFEFASCTG